ncbi:superinfection exclusion B family protein [Clostridium sp. KNHs214]|uniref:superinfection exclusion B family protein n=1 Tax=Clostridium sp. KNHs214 TaxID=1540257 RepID=UPI0005545416|nr:superinfection exclusion B family protein [Clostridium sp. KNHs214]
MKDFIEFLKLPPNILGALAIASGFLLFLPNRIIKKLYMLEFRNRYGFVIGVVFVVSLAILVVLLMSKVYHHFHDKKVAKKVSEGQIKYLKNMNQEKVMIIKAFLRESTHTLELPMNNGLIIELQHYFVITPAGQNHMVDMVNPHIKYFLQPWVGEKIETDEELKNKFAI